MANLALNSDRNYRGPTSYGRQPVGANVRVFVGQAMMAATGGIVNVTTGTGNDFVGFAAESVDNRTNAIPHGGAAGAVSADVYVAGTVELLVSNGEGSWSDNDVGLTVHATDGNTFTTTVSTHVKVGKVINVLDAVGKGAGAQTVLVYFNTAFSSLLVI